MALYLILIAAALIACSGLPGLFLSRESRSGQTIATTMIAIGSLTGLAASFSIFFTHAGDPTLALPGWLMSGGLSVKADALSAFFMIPTFLIGGLGSLYSVKYWDQAHHQDNGRKMRLFYGLMISGIIVLFLARHGIVFLVGWEMMALSAFFLIGTEDADAKVRQAAWLYLIATHVGTLTLFAMFCLFRQASGGFDLVPIPAGVAGAGTLTAIFVLALIGFGLKAGMMPLHFWLPPAHASAPSHVSAFMSGVLIKTGIYGLVRILSLLPPPPAYWGGALLALGAVSGIIGVAFAIAQHDIKRLLAYHSVENIGIILMGLGLATTGRALGRNDWLVLGLAGCLLHVWNHGLFKALLFFGAGSVIHATGTREIDRLGGLAKRMPLTSFLFLTGALAICGLPPLNGFISEFLIYIGLFRTMSNGGLATYSGATACVPALAMIGALALACFVKVHGAVFLGQPRDNRLSDAVESPRAMLLPMAVLATACLLIGLVPAIIAPILDRAIHCWSPESAATQVSDLAPLNTIGVLNAVLALSILTGWMVLARRLKKMPVGVTGTWDCGYARPTARMQYTASSFAQSLIELFQWVLGQKSNRPVIKDTFAEPKHFESHVDDVILDRMILPTAKTVQSRFGRLRGLQQGLTQHYILYILAAVAAMLIWISPLPDVLRKAFLE